MSTEFESAIEQLHRVIIPKDSNLEIELRFLVDERKTAPIRIHQYNTAETIQIAKDVIEKYSKPNTSVHISQSINFIDGNKTNQLVFINGVKQKDKQIYYEKKHIINGVFLQHNLYPACRLSAAFETKCAEFPIKDSKLCRIRLRYSIQLDFWKLEITLIKNIQDFSNPITIKDMKEKMLFEISEKTFIEKAPWEFTDIIEFEAEYTGLSSQFSIDKLKIINDIFTGINSIEGLAGDDDTIQIQSTSISTSIQAAQSTSPKINQEYQNIIYAIAKIIRPKEAGKFKTQNGLKQLGNQVIELDKNIFLQNIAPNAEHYYMTDKVDGKRAMIYMNGADCYILTDVLSSCKCKECKSASLYVFDAEEYEQSYYIFDVLVWDGTDISQQPFSERLKYFDKVTALNESFRTKPFIQMSKNFQRDIAKFKHEKKPYETDGIVLTPDSGTYTDMKVYKYKPLNKLSIDFLIKKCPDSLLGIEPYIPKPDSTLYILFCGISSYVMRNLGMRLIKGYKNIFPNIDLKRYPPYMPIQFEPSDCLICHIYHDKKSDLDGQVGEFTYLGNWKMLKIRTDRALDVQRGNYFGNNYKVAEMTWLNYKNPLIIEDLKSDVYFAEHDNILQKASREFNNFVKSNLLTRLKDTSETIPCLMDIASGKGQDMGKYSRAGIDELICLEIDPTAMMELINRKHIYSTTKDRKPMHLLTSILDINKSYKDNIAILDKLDIKPNSVDVIICNFAFHYFISNKKSLTNVVKFISHYLKQGGRFMFTAFDGSTVAKLLAENDGEWTVYKKDGESQASLVSSISSIMDDSQKFVKQYSIIRRYNGVNAALGNEIDVLLPFSKNEYYREYLVEINEITDAFDKSGMALELDQSFSEFLEEYKKQRYNDYTMLTLDDKKYISLYHAYCFYKKKVPVGGGARYRLK